MASFAKPDEKHMKLSIEERGMHFLLSLPPYLRYGIYIYLGISIMLGIYSSWCYSRLNNLLARYGSSVVINIYGRFAMDKKFQGDTENIMLNNYVRKKLFQKEQQPEIRDAGARAYKSGKLTMWFGTPAAIIIVYLIASYTQSR